MIIIILLLVCVGHLATDIYLPSLPAIASYFNVSTATVQITISAYLIGIASSPLIFGPLSDLRGRKKVILGGILVGLVATLCCSMAPNVYFLIVGRAMQGIAMGAIIVATRAIIPDCYSGKEMAKKITLVSMFMPLILSTAPILGGYLQEYFQWRAVFLFLVLYLVMLLIIIPNMPETLKHIPQSKSSKQSPMAIIYFYKNLISNLPFMFYGMCSVIPMVGLFAYLTISPFLFQNVLGLSPSKYGMLSLYIGCSILTYGYINTKLIKHFPLNKLLFVGAALIIFAGLLLLLFTYLGISTVAGILIPVLFYYSCLIISNANATSLALTYLDGSYGTARALLAACQFLAGALGSFIFSMLPILNGFYLAICFIINGLLIIFCILMAQRATRTTKNAMSVGATV